MNTHEQYEELCALAASGQASQDELEDLRSHLETCPGCRSSAYDFDQISAQALSRLAAKRLHCQIPSGMTQRFLARARTEGIAMTRENAPTTIPINKRAYFSRIAATAAIVLIAALLIIGRRRTPPVAREHFQPAAPQAPLTSTIGVPRNAGAEDSRLQQDLAAARSDLKSLRATIQAERTELQSANNDKESLNARLSEAEQENNLIQSEGARRDSRIAQLEDEIEKARAEKGASDTTLALQQLELRELRKQVSDEAAALEQQRELAARGSDVRDLVVARSLHIIDVHDRDGNGKSQPAFGRIFYTEGKSLIFYAYDLADPEKVNAKVSFYVWGERLGAEKPIRSLGVFHNDDANDARWVLTFDDPQVLAQINSVFVTAESSKKSIREPGGKRVLFAFLGDKPNHP